MKKATPAALATLSLAATLGLGAGPAHAGDYSRPLPTPGKTTTLADGLLSPLRIALGHGKSVDVAQSFGGTVDRVKSKGSIEQLDSMPGYFAGSVSRFGGTTYYTMTVGAGEGVPEANESLLKSIDRKGNIRTITDIAAYERVANPDGDTIYGFRDLDEECLAAQVDLGPFARYSGAQDSNPYATVAFGRHVLVADAGANAIFKVDQKGNVSTVAVLPAIPLEVTAEIAAALGIDPCAVGSTYYLEPVPTDLEVGWNGKLYVTSLPGGPEDPSLGARGSVFAVNAWNGTTRQVATGLTTPTGVALDKRGNLYVAELFANRISVVPHGSSQAQLLLEATLPGDVELRGSTLYATTDVLPGEGTPPDGKIIRVKLKGGHGWYQSGVDPTGDKADANQD
ncbi:ScyD/ScyE family protein [Arthrobacter sp. CAN_A1]|uniref:ScyD/ScyE family protein n=1 Tax=Arthrobacter sp. CAN_A1 TaxID=2787717 RepID=UPI0018C8D7BB